MKKNRVFIKNFDIIESVIDPKIIEIKEEYTDLVPIIIMSINSNDLPWNYDQWDLVDIDYDNSYILIKFKYLDKDPEVFITNDFFDINLIENLHRYKHFILTIVNDVKEDEVFYKTIN